MRISDTCQTTHTSKDGQKQPTLHPTRNKKQASYYSHMNETNTPPTVYLTDTEDLQSLRNTQKPTKQSHSHSTKRQDTLHDYHYQLPRKKMKKTPIPYHEANLNSTTRLKFFYIASSWTSPDHVQMKISYTNRLAN